MRDDLLPNDPKAVPIVCTEDVPEGVFERISQEVDASTRRRIVAVICDGVVGGHLCRREVFPFLHFQEAVRTLEGGGVNARSSTRMVTDEGEEEHLPDVGRDGEREVLYVIIPVVPLPRLSLGSDAVPDEDGLVLAVPHGDGDGGVVQEEAVPLPGRRGSCDPVVPAVEETFVDHLQVDDA